MASYCYSGKVEMKPEVEENVGSDFMEDEGYPFAIPKVYLEGCGEQYYPQLVFDWEDDSVVLVRDKRVLRYTRSSFVELLAKDEEGNVVWMDGRNAPYSGCWGGKYLNEERGAIEYKIEEYNLEQSEKKTYKVLLEETLKMDDNDRFRLKDFVDVKNFQMTEEEKFEIEDGVLKSYSGYDTDLVIPEGVTSIDRNALPYRAKAFESIMFPKTLIEVPDMMIANVKVKKIEVVEGNSRYYTENGLLIDRQNKTLVWAYSGSEIPIDGSVVSIGKMAFKGRTDLKNIIIPKTIIKIECGAFSGCTALEEINLPNSITEMDSGAFQDCTSLKQVTLPQFITQINDYMFEGCSNLMEVVIPKSVKSIGNSVLSGCISLKEIVIPDSVVEVGKSLFNGCAGLERVEIPVSITSISDGMFYDCIALLEVAIPHSVVRIGRNAFHGCSGLKKVDIPDSVKYIGRCAFEGCRSLENVKLPAFIVELAMETFQNCLELKNIQLPRHLLKIGYRAFSCCKNLSLLELPDGLVEIEGNAFTGSGLIKLNLPDSVKLLNDNALAGCMELRNFDVPEVFQGDEERIFGGGLQRETDGRYLVKGSSARNFSGFVF